MKCNFLLNLTLISVTLGVSHVTNVTTEPMGNAVLESIGKPKNTWMALASEGSFSSFSF